MLIVAMAPSLNSKEVPPSTTMQASQHRERTHTLKQHRHHNIVKRRIFTVNWHLAFVLRLGKVHRLAGVASLPTAGEDSVDDGLPDAVEQTPVVRTEHQGLVVFIGNWTHTFHRHIKNKVPFQVNNKYRRIINSPLSMKSRLSGISRPVWDFPRHIKKRQWSQVTYLETNLVYFIWLTLF